LRLKNCILFPAISKTVEEDQDYSFDLQEQNLELAFDEFGDVEAEIEWLKQENKILGIRYTYVSVAKHVFSRIKGNVPIEKRGQNWFTKNYE
jgi:hypothetical protein